MSRRVATTFGAFELNSEAGELRREGITVDLEPTPFRLLAYLVEHNDRSVPKHELLDRVWPDVVVSDTALSSALKELRRALGDDGQSQRYVRTRRGRGYRFVCPIQATPEPDETTKAATRVPCIAVLPFVSRSSSEHDEYFADGVTEDLITKLTKIQDLCVVSSGASARFKKSEESVAEIAEALGVDMLLTGSLRHTSDRVRISARLIDGETERVLWAETYDDRLDDILRIQQDVAERIVGALEVELSPRDRMALSFRATPNVGAYDLYLRGRAQYRRWERPSNEAAIELYKKAIEADPNFALAYAGLANAYGLRGTNFGAGDEWADTAIEHANRALEISGELPEAHKALGLAFHCRGWKKRALSAYLRAVEIRPSYDEATYNVSQALFELGRWDEAVGWQKRRIQLAPTPEAVGASTYAWYLWCVGFGEESARWFDIGMSDRPLLVEANLWMAKRDLVEGDVDGARRRVQRIRDIEPRSVETLVLAGSIEAVAGHDEEAKAIFSVALDASDGRDAYTHVALARIDNIAGETNDAERHLEAADSIGHAQLARGTDDGTPRWILSTTAALRNRSDEAIARLGEAIDAGHRFHRWDRLEPAFEGLRLDKRFTELLERMTSEVDTMHARVAQERWHRIDGRPPHLT